MMRLTRQEVQKTAEQTFGTSGRAPGRELRIQNSIENAAA